MQKIAKIAYCLIFKLLIKGKRRLWNELLLILGIDREQISTEIHEGKRIDLFSVKTHRKFNWWNLIPELINDNFAKIQFRAYFDQSKFNRKRWVSFKMKLPSGFDCVSRTSWLYKLNFYTYRVVGKTKLGQLWLVDVDEWIFNIWQADFIFGIDSFIRCGFNFQWLTRDNIKHIETCFAIYQNLLFGIFILQFMTNFDWKWAACSTKVRPSDSFQSMWTCH